MLRIYLSKERLALNSSFCVLDPDHSLFALEVVICFARIKVLS